MPKRKPAGWPKLMVERRLKGGAVGYYWAVPTWAAKAGCPVGGEALGTDYAAAKQRCDDFLNPQYDSWRTQGTSDDIEARVRPGTFDWLVGIYKMSPKYSADIQARTRKSYDAALALISNYIIKDGRTFGSLSLSSVTPGVADILAAKLLAKADGGARPRTVKLAMTAAQRAWNVAWRSKPDQVPSINPFAKMGLSHTAAPTRAVTHEELARFVAAADNAGESSLGTAAMIAFYWLQREVDILTRLSWTHYRPSGNPNIARIFHYKTGALVDCPLYDDDGTVLWPEIMGRLDAADRRGTLIVMREDRRRKMHLQWREDYFRHRVADIREAAGIDRECKFMGLRHGGNTEGADAGLSDAQLRALSGHRTAAMTTLYAKETMKQRKVGARKRLNQRTNQGDLSK
jgi:hypothetical protein